MSQALKTASAGRLLSDPGLLRTQACIDGEWIDADDGSTFRVLNPANHEVVAEVANLGGAETRRAIDAAEAARHAWAARSAFERSAVLRKWHELILGNVEDLAIIMTLEQGKVLAESRGEIAYAASFIEWFAEEAKRIYGEILPQPQTDRRGIVIRQPVGVCAAITPWNFPSAMLARKAAPALAVGCSMVAKPPHETPLSMLAMAELAQRAGLPAGLLNVVPTEASRVVGEELCSNPTVRKLSFTGSTAVGKILTKQCAGTLKRLSMELGGNAPAIVFDDADLEQAATGVALAKYRNSGQTCICVNRILVQESIYDEFVDELKKVVGTYRIGDGMDESVTHGPVITREALEGIRELVDDAIERGATVAAGGAFGEGDSHFVEPTILCNVSDDMRVFGEEIFGPVAPIFKFGTEEEAIAMANDTEFGLASYVYTRDQGRCWRVAEAIEYGMVGVNETMISSAYFPFGGIKESGQGREGSHFGVEDYLETKYVCLGGLGA
ncbi:MAG: NAD-dependent succinate-semialdehyde dehydrogenase [Proteobacteria bacterium]|nr:NAD-dependent succinate-semialdehyde dehydrogenase [Pseudomonadota bacterium]